MWPSVPPPDPVAPAGATDELLKRGAIVPGVTHLSGLSGGAHTAIALHMGWNGSQQLAFWRGVFEDCYAVYGKACGPGGHLTSVLRAHYMKYLPHDIHKRGGWCLAVHAADLGAASACHPPTHFCPECLPRFNLIAWAPACSGGEAADRCQPAGC